MARQKFGQHFLISGKVLDRIVKALDVTDVLVVEIGPGRGALTESLLRSARQVAAIELDRELAEQLRAKWGEHPRFELIEGDALQQDWGQWGAGVLTGNLPYYIATPLISRYLRHPAALRHAVFLIQKEVAERISAAPGTRDYGYFSVECQFLSTPEYLFTVAPGAFRPPPQVESAVIRLTPKIPDPNISIEGFLRFASACFRQKRKTLRNNLSAVYGRKVLAGIDGLGLRAEQLGLTDLLQLYQSLSRGDR